MPNEELMVDKKVSEQDKPKYIRKDVKGGYLYNPNEIKYYSKIEQIDVYDNLLLGEWGKRGEYKIDELIRKQLLHMKKYYTSSFGDNMFCETYENVDEFGKIEFSVNLKNNTPKTGYMTATLNVLEDIDRANGYYQNTNTGLVEVYSAIDGPSFVNDCFAHFHIYQRKEDGLLDKENPEVDEIVRRKKFLLQQKQKLMPKLDGYFKKLVDKKVKALKESKVGKEIVDKFYGDGATITGFFIKKGMLGYNRFLNQMLDGILDMQSALVLSDVKLKAQINEANNSFVSEINGGKTREETVTLQQGNEQVKITQQVEESTK